MADAFAAVLSRDHQASDAPVQHSAEEPLEPESAIILEVLPESPATVQSNVLASELREALEEHRKALGRLLRKWASQEDNLLQGFMSIANGATVRSIDSVCTRDLSTPDDTPVLSDCQPGAGSGAAKCKNITISLDIEAQSLGCTIEWSSPEPLVGDILTDSIAAQQGLVVGDRIIEINGIATKGKGRNILLPLIQQRPVEIKLQRQVGRCHAKRSVTGLHSSIPERCLHHEGMQQRKMKEEALHESDDDESNDGRPRRTQQKRQPVDPDSGSPRERSVKQARSTLPQEANSCEDLTRPEMVNQSSFNQAEETRSSQRTLFAYLGPSRTFSAVTGTVTDSMNGIRSWFRGGKSASMITGTKDLSGDAHESGERVTIFDDKKNFTNGSTRNILRQQRMEEIQALFGKRAAVADQKLYDCWERFEEPAREGRLYRFISSPKFETLCVSVILCNAFLIVHKTDQRMWSAIFPEMPSTLSNPMYTYIEYCFLTFYTAEMLLKLLVHKVYFFLNDQARWNTFEFILVISSFMEACLGATSSFVFLRSFRLLKVLRLIRALRFLKELRLMMTSMTGCISPLFWSCIMLFFFLCLFSIMFTSSVADFLANNQDLEPEVKEGLADLFPSVAGGMISLLEAVSGGDDWANGYNLLVPVGYFAAILYIFFILFFLISVWNVVTSLFIEKAMSLAQPDLNQLIYEQQVRDMRYAEELSEMTEDLDSDHSGTISYAEFLNYFENDQYRSFFSARGIEIKDAKKFFQILSSISGTDEIDRESFVHGCMRMKGIASSLDVQTIRFECRLMHSYVREQFSYLKKVIKKSGARKEPLL